MEPFEKRYRHGRRRRQPQLRFAHRFLVGVSTEDLPGKHLHDVLSRLLVLLDRIRLPSLSMSCKSCARGVALSMLYRTGFTSVEMGSLGGCPEDFLTERSVSIRNT